jgi:hypothetical protein
MVGRRLVAGEGDEDGSGKKHNDSDGTERHERAHDRHPATPSVTHRGDGSARRASELPVDLGLETPPGRLETGSGRLGGAVHVTVQKFQFIAHWMCSSAIG